MDHQINLKDMIFLNVHNLIKESDLEDIANDIAVDILDKWLKKHPHASKFFNFSLRLI